MVKNYDLVHNRDIKNLLKRNPKLVIMDKSGKELYCCKNIQCLYLYPLSIIDYIYNLVDKRIIFLNIIDIDIKVNYKNLLDGKEFNALKAVEILIKDDYDDIKMKKIYEIIEYLSSRNILVSLNIKNLVKIKDSIISYLKYVTYFKVFLESKIEEKSYSKFLDKLLFIKNNCLANSLIHVKTYLNLLQVNSYENMINDFSNLKVDIFQVSKELIPLESDNINVNKNIQTIIRNLEKKYNDYDKCKFISVKDISTLYYPRFELDERNSRVCYASKMKPYLYGDKLLPCKVNKVLQNLNEWKLNYNNLTDLNKVFNKCGAKCDDCASIFENDLLYDIENIINNNACDIVLKEQ